MFANINEEIISRLDKYSSRRLDIIFSEPEDLDRYPSEKELKELVEVCDKNYDYDALSEINSKYDLSFLSKQEEGEIQVSKEEIGKAKAEFTAYMRLVHPNFDFEVNNE